MNTYHGFLTGRSTRVCQNAVIFFAFCVLFLTACGAAPPVKDNGASAAKSESVTEITPASKPADDTNATTSPALPETKTAPVPAESDSETDKVVIELSKNAVEMFGITEDSKNHDTPFETIDLHADGTCTLITSREKHAEVMEGIKGIVDDSLESLKGSANYPNITKVEANRDYTEVNVSMKTDTLSVTESFAAFEIYYLAHLYHVFNATPDNNIYVRFIDEKTGKTIDSGDYHSYLERHPEETVK